MSLVAPTRSRTYSNGDIDILGKYDALEFNDKEVDELFDILGCSFEAFARNGIVLAGTNLRCEALFEDKLASNLCGGNNCLASASIKEFPAEDRPTTQNYVGELEEELQNWDVAREEDECDDTDVCYTRDTRILPAQNVEEHGMVMCQVLASGSLSIGHLASRGDIAELIRSLVCLLLGGLDDGALCDVLSGRVIGDVVVCGRRI